MVLALWGLIAGCGPGPTGATASPRPASPRPASPTAAPSPASLAAPTPPPEPTASPTRPRPSATPTATPQLETATIRYSGALSIEDLNTLILDLLALPGVVDVQGGVQILDVTYDPEQIDRRQIAEVVISHGYTLQGEP